MILWTFNTRKLTVVCTAEPTSKPDKEGYLMFDIIVRLQFRHNKLTLAYSTLSECQYSRKGVKEFTKEHFCGTSYFPDMVRECIREARHVLPALRKAV